MKTSRPRDSADAIDVAVDPDASADVNGSIVNGSIVNGSIDAVEPIEATADFPVVLEATAEFPVASSAVAIALIEPSAMADPHSANSPMSPDDQVSDKHTGLSIDSHSTGGTTPQS